MKNETPFLFALMKIALLVLFCSTSAGTELKKNNHQSSQGWPPGQRPILGLFGAITGDFERALQSLKDNAQKDHQNPNSDVPVIYIRFLHMTHTIPWGRRWFPVGRLKWGDLRAQTMPMFVNEDKEAANQQQQITVNRQPKRDIYTFHGQISHIASHNPPYAMYTFDADDVVHLPALPDNEKQGKALEKFAHEIFDEQAQRENCKNRNNLKLAAVVFLALYDKTAMKMVGQAIPVAEISADELCQMRRNQLLGIPTLNIGNIQINLLKVTQAEPAKNKPSGKSEMKGSGDSKKFAFPSLWSQKRTAVGTT